MPETQLARAATMHPFLRYQNAQAAVEWLVRAFSLESRAVHPGPDGTVVHAELGWGGSVLMLGSVKEPGSGEDLGLRTARELGGVTQGIYMYVPDIDAHYARACVAGAEIVYPLRQTDYGSREYAARDLEGSLWSFGTYQPGASA